MKVFNFGDIVREKCSGILAEVAKPFSQDANLYLIELETDATGISPIGCYDPEDFEFVSHGDGTQWLERK